MKLFFFLLLVVHVFGQATIPCTYTDGSTGYIYDLNGLVDNNQDYVVTVPTGTDSQTVVGYKITLNICRPILLTACANQAGSNCDACQQWPLENVSHNNALGSTLATTFGSALDSSGEDSEGVTMYFAGYQSTITLNFLCDSKAGNGTPTYVSKPTSTNFLLQWKSYYGCATNGPVIGSSSSGSGYSSSSSSWNIGPKEAKLILGLTFVCGLLMGIIIASFCWCLRVRSVKAKIKRKALDESRAALFGPYREPSAPVNSTPYQ